MSAHARHDIRGDVRGGAREELAVRLTRADVDVVRDGDVWRAVPVDAAAVVRIVREAREVVHAPRLVPLGGGTRIGAARPDLVLPGALADTLFVDLGRLSGIVEYQPGDGTLTALAGTPWRELAAVVDEGGHELTPDVSPTARIAPRIAASGAQSVPGTGRSTLGGVLAAGVSGPDRLRLGPTRHHVLGALVATGSGTLARSGGRLVKNVTGFDVFRLHVGGRGTLGVLLEASLRLVPKPEHEALLELDGLALGDAFALAERLRRTQVEPRAVWVTNVLRDGATLALHLAGRSAQVTRDAATLLAELGPAAHTREGRAAREGATSYRDTRASFAPFVGLGAREDELVLQVGCVPSAAEAALRGLLRWAERRGFQGPAHVVAWPGVASIDFALPAPAGLAATREGALTALCAELRALGARVRAAGGALAVDTALACLRKAAPPDAARWEAALATGLDPARLFEARPLDVPSRTSAAGGTA
jgi:FAD/FMN-containing dehydrogenase